MSQPQTNCDNQVNNVYSSRNRGNFKQGMDRNHRNYYYNPPYNKFQYYTTKYNFQPRWGYYNRRRPPHQRPPRRNTNKEPQRSPSPFSGTEEYTLRKIQETSDMIKKRLMMPPEADETSAIAVISPAQGHVEETVSDDRADKNENERTTTKSSKKVLQYNVEEIHNKIITHITNLNHGKKVNLICANSTGYDVAIQQIQKQKRLELSKALRDMCSNQTVENSDVFNAIMPDIGIKIEELPLEVIQELSSTLDLNFDDTSLQSSAETVISVKTEVDYNNEFVYKFPCNIKQEIIDDCDDVRDEAVHDVINDSPVKSLEMNSCETNEPAVNLSPAINKEFSEIKTEVKDEFAVSSDNVSQVNSSQLLQPVPESRLSITVGLQTDGVNCKSISTQTDPAESSCSHFQIKDGINSLGAAIEEMLDIDKEIARLTELRQSMFINIQTNKTDASKRKKPCVIKKKATLSIVQKSKTHAIKEKTIAKNLMKKDRPIKTKKKLKKLEDSCTEVLAEKQNNHLDTPGEKDNLVVTEEQNTSVVPEEKNKNLYYKRELDFAQISEKILVMKKFGDKLLAASEKGNLFFMSLHSGRTLSVCQISQAPITSLCLWNVKKKHLFVGCFETQFYQYCLTKNAVVRSTKLGECVQCMEQAWNWIFIGTANGNLMRYSLQRWKVDFEEKISKDSVLVLKATQEGARRVLLVGTRNAPVCVRDAMSGLHLRTMNEIVSPTVYTLLLENSMVYCGTTFHDILVYNFHDGNLVYKHQATNSKGVCCMKVVDNLLFASCHNGNIYVYNVKNHRYVGVIEGPGGVILSMEVLKNIVIVGTMSFQLKSVLIPEYILKGNEI